ncbi:alpha/beta fold hydrolase [Roseivirga sp. BDSF3-8]|uniref:alpha/beta fold hydrolase n=1 Tax=Roseivirga sp. BDSF3-8 TaxID=3241598 RepID=UPI003532551D
MPAKPPLLLLHGALGSKDQFATLGQKLSETFEIHSLNFSGHGGRSVQPEPFTIHSFGRDVLVYLDEHKLEKPNTFGFSMGGYVALWLARFHPTRIGRIMTLGTKFNWTPQAAVKEKAMLDPDTILEKVPKFATMLKERHAPSNWRTVLHKTAEMMEGLGNGECLKDKDFEAIDHLTRICVGSEDTMVTTIESQHVAGLIPGGTFFLFNNFTHPIERADTGLLSEEITEFMTKA